MIDLVLEEQAGQGHATFSDQVYSASCITPPLRIYPPLSLSEPLSASLPDRT